MSDIADHACDAADGGSATEVMAAGERLESHWQQARADRAGGGLLRAEMMIDDGKHGSGGYPCCTI